MFYFCVHILLQYDFSIYNLFNKAKKVEIFFSF